MTSIIFYLLIIYFTIIFFFDYFLNQKEINHNNMNYYLNDDNEIYDINNNIDTLFDFFIFSELIE